MSLLTHGCSASEPEITNISKHGIWLLTNCNEFFLSYENFPWFKEQPIKSIVNFEEQSLGHFYWPDIDIDLTLESIKHPEHYPQVAS